MSPQVDVNSTPRYIALVTLPRGVFVAGVVGIGVLFLFVVTFSQLDFSTLKDISHLLSQKSAF